MVRMIHALTGSVMYVHETRAAEYAAAGHIPAAEPAPRPPIGFAAGGDAPKRKPARRTTKKE